MCSPTSASVKGADREHSPAPGSVKAAVISAPAGGSTAGSPQETVCSSAAPVAGPPIPASAARRCRRCPISIIRATENGAPPTGIQLTTR